MKKAFTLIELMIVVMIIGTLLAVMIPRVGTTIDKAREKSCQKNLQSIQAAITTYCIRPGADEVYPNTIDQLKGILEQYFPQEIPIATLKKSVENSSCNEVHIGPSTATITNDGGWFLITDSQSSDAGRVFVNSFEKDLEGKYYSSYPSW